MGIKIKLKPTKHYSDEHFTVGDYVISSIFPHLTLRIAGIAGAPETPFSGLYSVIKIGEIECEPVPMQECFLYLEKPSPLRYFLPSNYRKNVYHLTSKDYWVFEDVIVSHKGHRFDSVICRQPISNVSNGEFKTGTFPLQDVMLIRETHCKNGQCKASLDIHNNRGVCPDCGWFVCHKCGSHGCDEITVDTKVRDYLCYLRELKNPNFRLEQGPFTSITNE